MTKQRLIKPSFLEGMARSVDMGSVIRTYQLDDDYKQGLEAIRSYFKAAGNYIAYGISAYERQSKKEAHNGRKDRN